MPWVEYRTGVTAPDGYQERSSGYRCDVSGCKQEAVEPDEIGNPMSGLCEDHLAEFLREEEENAREYRKYERAYLGIPEEEA